MITTLSIISMDQGRGIYVTVPAPTEDFVPPLVGSQKSGFSHISTVLAYGRRFAARVAAGRHGETSEPLQAH